MQSPLNGQFIHKFKEGQKVGKLTLIKFTGERSFTYWVWLCQCECGKRVKKTTQRLSKQTIPSCGCATVLGRKRTRLCPITNSLYHNYKRASKTRGHSFELSWNEFYELINKPCHFCGLPPFQSYKNTSSPNRIIRGGIDRIDSKKGYLTHNVVPCCKFCNVAKGTMTISEFKKWIIRVHEFFIH